MRNHASIFAIVVAAAILVPTGAATAQTAPAPDEIVFVPPALGAPGNRVGAGTRGGVANTPGIALLAPPGGGMTASDQPTLYWWLEVPFAGELSVSLGAANAARQLISTREAVDLPAGQHAFALADYGLRLSAGTIYRWTVTLDPAGGGAKISGSSFVQLSESAIPSTTTADPAEANRQAAAGNWYDAFAAVADDPDTSVLRDALLHQVGIEID
jgi:hypothetical protein